MSGFTCEIATLRATSQAPDGAVGRWFVSPHAVRAYARRWLGWKGRDIAMPDALYRRALGEIIKESATAKYVRPLPGGAQLWRGARPRKHRFVVVEVDGPGLPVLATVL